MALDWCKLSADINIHDVLNSHTKAVCPTSILIPGTIAILVLLMLILVVYVILAKNCKLHEREGQTPCHRNAIAWRYFDQEEEHVEISASYD